MSQNSGVDWTEVTWVPVTGCDKISPGCKNCYAIGMSWRLMHITKMADKYKGTVEKTEGGQLNWTGKINMVQESLTFPLEIKKPSLIFIDSMGDLFHEKVDFRFILQCYAVMLIADQHIYQVLTKRIDRAVEFYKWVDQLPLFEMMRICAPVARYSDKFKVGNKWWLMDHVWMGTSVEDQERADLRIPLLLQVPAAVRWLSMEPLISRVNMHLFTGKVLDWKIAQVALNKPSQGIDWVVVGGESGSKARPMLYEWAEDIFHQCREAVIPFFFKQWGSWVSFDNMPFEEQSKIRTGQSVPQIQVFEGDNGIIYHLHKLGKHASGKKLFGQEYLNYPKQYELRSGNTPAKAEEAV